MTAPTLPTIVHMPPGPASTLQVKQMALQFDTVWRFIAPAGKLVWHLGGGKAPTAGAEPGMILKQISGLMAPPKLVDLQGARQHGVTNTDMVLDPAEVDMVLEASSPLNTAMLPDPNGMRRMVRWWTESWAGNRQGKLSCATPELGEWWMPVRQYKPFAEQIKLSYTQSGALQFGWAARGDDSVWFSFDSEAEAFATSGGVTTAWLPLFNRGTLEGWPRFLVYGPGYVDIGDGVSGRTVTFGPLLDGQVVLITTLPRLRSVIDLTPTQTLPTPQQLNGFELLLKDLIDFATNNNTPPLLQMFESFFGIRPPQGQLYGLLRGRFGNPIPAQEEAQPPTAVRIPVRFHDGTGLAPLTPGWFQLPQIVPPVAGRSRVVAALTPMRTWPE